ncbi:hypothetical protein [Flavobacterium sp. ZE23DGlu08]|uniref:hypothetical protein n=1 Tax=Flavobacterium sp. ZE23DGlu08 TaxID=3059026 RepID=UPI00265DC881|nr:hypothetical protein [Flavobacterium sp. ZE23DGlu08]WKL43800.1 hypothetical protein Q1W72_15810 [Flavobacterium sp. ZE23DGlu08]
MNYLEIILRGYYNENDRKFLNKYFIRECEKAKKEHYDLEEFFNVLTNGIELLKREIQDRLYKRQHELYLIQDNGNEEYIEYCENELSTLSFEKFPINLLLLTNDKFRGNLYYSEVLFIDEKINEAQKELNQPQQTQDHESVSNYEVYKTQNLFKVGLLFAKGELNKYFTVNAKKTTVMNEGYSAPKIANELGNVSFNKWVLATINNYPTDNVNGNKNVFNSLEMMTKIIDHCKANNLAIDPYFINRLPID